MDDIKNTVVAKLAKIAGEMGAISKERKPGSQLNYGYQGIDEIVNTANPLLSKEGIIMKTKIIEKNVSFATVDTKYSKGVLQTTAEITCKFTFTDGVSKLSTYESAIKTDFGDKAVTQAVSMCMKYALIRLFLIKTQSTDPDEPHTVEHGTTNVLQSEKDVEIESKRKLLETLKAAGLDKEFAGLSKEEMGSIFNNWQNGVTSADGLKLSIENIKKAKQNDNTSKR